MNRTIIRIALSIALASTFVEAVPAQRGGRGATPAAPPAGTATETLPVFGAAPAQTPTPPPGLPPQFERIPMRVSLVLSRFDGDRRLSTVPFTIMGITGAKASLRLGNRVGFRKANPPGTPADAKPGEQASSYIDLGTNIDLTVTPIDGTHLRVELTLVESSFGDPPSAGRGASAAIAPEPVFRNFSYTGQALLQDGETQQIVNSTEKISGETIKLDISLKLLR